jgi:integrase/recombinase XerC
VNHLVPLYSRAPVPALVAAPDERASMRFLEFFAANIRNPHTRRAYARAAEEFPAWCAAAGVSSAASAHDATPGAGSTTSSQPSPFKGGGL